MTPRLALSLCTATLTVSVASTSWACSLAPYGTVQWPKDGAQNVPLSTYIFISGEHSESLKLLDSDGHEVEMSFERLPIAPFKITSKMSWSVAVPTELLRPNTTYTLDTITFTTGNDEFGPSLEPIELEKYALRQHGIKSLDPPESSCNDLKRYNTYRSITLQNPNYTAPILYIINDQHFMESFEDHDDDRQSLRFKVYEKRNDTINNNPESLCLTVTAMDISGRTTSLDTLCDPEILTNDEDTGCSTLSTSHKPTPAAPLVVLFATLIPILTRRLR